MLARTRLKHDGPQQAWQEEKTASGDRARASTGNSQTKNKTRQATTGLDLSELGAKQSSVSVGNIRVRLEQCEARPGHSMVREETT